MLNGPNLGRLGSREPEVYGRPHTPTWSSLCESGGGPGWASTSARPRTRQNSSAGSTRPSTPDADRDQPGGLHPLLLCAARCTGAVLGPVIEVHLSNPHRARNSATPRSSPRSSRERSRASAWTPTSSPYALTAITTEAAEPGGYPPRSPSLLAVGLRDLPARPALEGQPPRARRRRFGVVRLAGTLVLLGIAPPAIH